MRLMMMAVIWCALCCALGANAYAALDGGPQYELLKKMRAECVGLTGVGKDEEALEVRRRILQQFPQFPFACAPTQYEIGQYYEKKGLTDKAMAEYTALVEKYPREDAAAEASWKLVAHHASRGGADGAREYLTNLVEHHPQFKVRDRIGHLPDFDARIELWKTLVELLTAAPDERRSLQRQIGIALQEAGRYEQAVREFTVLIETCEDNAAYVAGGLWRRAWCDLDLMRYDDAKKCLQRIFDEYPKSFLMDEAVKMYGQALIHDPGPEKALEYFRAIAEDEANTAGLRSSALISIGRIKGDLGDVDGAIAAFDECRTQHPQSAASALYYKCELLARSRRLDEAVKVQEELAKADAARGLMALGHIESARRNHQEAYARFQAASRAAKDAGTKSRALLYAYSEKLALGDVKQAEKIKRELVRTAPRAARTSTILLTCELEPDEGG